MRRKFRDKVFPDLHLTLTGAQLRQSLVYSAPSPLSATFTLQPLIWTPGVLYATWTWG